MGFPRGNRRWRGSPTPHSTSTLNSSYRLVNCPRRNHRNPWSCRQTLHQTTPRASTNIDARKIPSDAATTTPKQARQSTKPPETLPIFNSQVLTQFYRRSMEASMGSGAPKQSTSQRTGTRWPKADVSSALDEMRTERDRIQQEMVTKLWACNPKVVVTAGRCRPITTTVLQP